MERVVLFDIDGTLLRAGDPDHLACFEAALTEVHGRAVTLQGIPLGGNIERVIARMAAVAAGVPEAEATARLQEVTAELGRRYTEACGDRTDRLLPGLPDAVRAARDAGWMTGVLTGGARVVARLKLVRSGLDELLPFGAYGDEADERHHLVPMALEEAGVADPAACVLVGDTPRDVEAGRLSGCPVIAVATGRWDARDLVASGADAVLRDLSDVDGFLGALERFGP